MTRRVWELNAAAPLALTLAADARTTPTDYRDDQVWELSLGAPGMPAMALSTRFGRRVGLASVVPMWWLGNHSIFEYDSYSSAPRISAFAPGYLQTEAHLSRDIPIQAGYYALDSHTIGMRFTLRNVSSRPAKVNLDLVAFIASEGLERKVYGLRSRNGAAALTFGRCDNIEPVLVLEGGSPGNSPHKLSTLTVIPARGSVTVRAVVAGGLRAGQSQDLAEGWLKASWNKPPVPGARSRAAPPDIETGDSDLDALLAFSYHQALQALVRVKGKLPQPSFVALRQPDEGFRPLQDPENPGIARSRSGQQPTTAYLLALALAPVAPDAAQGILLNYLAVQKADGWIDWAPGVAGEARGILCLPLLARLAWSLWQYTEDITFLERVFDPLSRFLDRWLAPDLDGDGDGAPEWQSEAQTAYPFLPIFSRGLTEGQTADIRYVESPDLIAYLLSEALSLREMAAILNRTADHEVLSERVDQIKRVLATFWRDDLHRYTHRDRDSHGCAPAVELFHDRPATERTVGPLRFQSASRLIVEIVGGTSRPNAMTMTIIGLNDDDEPIEEHVPADDFAWTAGRGTYTSHLAYRQVDQIVIQGLVPLFKYSARTVDTTPLDITALMPLWAVDVEPERRDDLLRLLRSPEDFWRKHGVIMYSARDPQYQPHRIEFAAGVWGFWQTLMGEALIEAGEYAAAADLLRRLFAGMLPVVKQKKAFYEGYHADRVEGLGARGHVGGLAPLHLFLRVIGVRIISGDRVWTGGPFPWDRPVTISHQGVTVHRTADGTRITFPSGDVIELPADAPWQLVTPPHAPDE